MIRMPYGNCLVGAWILSRHFPDSFLVYSWCNPLVPHFLVVDRTTGQCWHYTVKRDIFCWPFCYLLFAGEFRRHHGREKN